MFRLLFVFFSILALLIFAAAIMIKRDKPAPQEGSAHPSSVATEASLAGEQSLQRSDSEIEQAAPATEATQQSSDSSSVKTEATKASTPRSTLPVCTFAGNATRRFTLRGTSSSRDAVGLRSTMRLRARCGAKLTPMVRVLRFCVRIVVGILVMFSKANV